MANKERIRLQRIKKANEEWLNRDKPKRQRAKDNAWKHGSCLSHMQRANLGYTNI
jgi:hypothetical protein